jgi:hypothetical protein
VPKSAGFKVSAYRQTGTSERWGLRVYFRPAPGKKAVRVLSTVLQYLMAQVHDRRPNETLHDLADRVASRWGSRFTGRTLRGWLASFLDNDLKFPLNGRGKWARELLILEEDMLLKFKRWLIGRVKKEDLSVDTAHALINEQLLKPLTETEEGREMLREYKISHPIGLLDLRALPRASRGRARRDRVPLPGLPGRDRGRLELGPRAAP